jgi:hypothetical protein
MWRLASLAAVLLLASGCMTTRTEVVGEEDPGPQGPTISLVVMNATAEELEVGYDYESGLGGGGGGGTVSACSSTVMTMGLIEGSYTITVEGVPEHEGTLPAGAPVDSFVVFRVAIGPDREVDVTGPGIAMREPSEPPNPPGCA